MSDRPEHKWLTLAPQLAMRKFPKARSFPPLSVDDRNVAFHEAAHAVLLELTGRRIGGATIDPNRAGGAAGRAWTEGTSIRHIAERQVDAPLTDPTFPEVGALIMCWAATLYAGKQAEYLLHRLDPGGYVVADEPDDRKARWLLSLAFRSPRWPSPIGGAQALARLMLREHWLAIEAIGTLLLRQKTITGDEIRGVLDRHAQ